MTKKLRKIIIIVGSIAALAIIIALIVLSGNNSGSIPSETPKDTEQQTTESATVPTITPTQTAEVTEQSTETAEPSRTPLVWHTPDPTPTPAPTPVPTPTRPPVEELVDFNLEEHGLSIKIPKEWQESASIKRMPEPPSENAVDGYDIFFTPEGITVDDQYFLGWIGIYTAEKWYSFDKEAVEDLAVIGEVDGNVIIYSCLANNEYFEYGSEMAQKLNDLLIFKEEAPALLTVEKNQ